MTVDLNTCIPGQLVELRNGLIVRYGYRSRDEGARYSHIVGDFTYTDGGNYYACREEDDNDVVRILQLDKPKQPKPDKHPSVAWWESCPWITDRLPTIDDTPQKGWNAEYVLLYKDDLVKTRCYTQVTKDEMWIHVQDWQPLKQTPREKALALIAKHKDSSTVGVWVPTPDEWDIIREGLTE